MGRRDTRMDMDLELSGHRELHLWFGFGLGRSASLVAFDLDGGMEGRKGIRTDTHAYLRSPWDKTGIYIPIYRRASAVPTYLHDWRYLNLDTTHPLRGPTPPLPSLNWRLNLSCDMACRELPPSYCQHDMSLGGSEHPCSPPPPHNDLFPLSSPLSSPLPLPPDIGTSHPALRR